MSKVAVVGAGLAGCEAAWALAQAGVQVTLCEMKPAAYSPAHSHPGFAELVCSNSLKAMRLESAAGLLKEEMRLMGSLLLQCAEKTAVSAGGALAVDRAAFSDMVTEKVCAHPNIRVAQQQVDEIPEGYAIIATGPLTADKLAQSIARRCGSGYLSFYDAAAPIVAFDSIDTGKTFFAARYDRGEADYINCPFDKEQYERFWQALTEAEQAPLHEFDARPTVYEGCMPVEAMARRGMDTLRFGPLRPVGLRDPKTGQRPWAVVQLRRENAAGSLYNLVGFQTNLKFPEQKRVFSMIPGLENAEFVRYGVMHRNTFIDSPRLLNSDFSLRADPQLYFAGQITGVEGYIESAASGIVAGLNLARRLEGQPPLALPPNTMIGALAAYISDPTVTQFQPMGCNMGLLPAPQPHIKDKRLRYKAMAEAAVAEITSLMKE